MGHEPDRLGPEPYVFVLEVPSEVGIDRRAHRQRVAHDPEGRRGAVDEVGLIGEVVEQSQVVFDHEHPGAFAEPPEVAGHFEPTDDVEVARWLVEQIEVGGRGQGPGDGRQLELSAREFRKAAVGERVEPDLPQRRVGADILPDRTPRPDRSARRTGA